MKWIVFVALIGLIAPLTVLLRSQPKYLVHASFLMGLLVFFLDPYFNIAPVAWHWSDAIKGYELTIIDIIAGAMILATPRVKIPAGLIVGLGIYIVALGVSTLAAAQMIPATFYIWQFLRAILVCWAVARASASVKGAPIALVAGLGTAILYEAVVATKQYLGGNPQPGGTLGHRNILGMASHFAVMPALALLLAGRRTALATLVVLGGAVIAVMGGGRATIGLYAMGVILTTALSIRHKMTGRKGAVAAAAFVGLLVAAPVMMWAVDRRSNAAKESSDEERGALIRAARMIISDYPMGVGANQYLLVANVGGYSNRAGVAWNYTSRAAPVHNSYYLVTAEMGFIGLIGLVTMLGSMIVVGLRTIRRTVADERSELLIGCLAALILGCVHMAFEWVFVLNSIHYLVAMNFGALIGIAASVRKRSSVRARRAAPALAGSLASQTG